MPLSKKLLQRRWTHSHEEDTATTVVYRPESFDFPPSRGRRSFELGPAGRYTESASGPVDRPQASRGTWKLDGETIVIRIVKPKAERVLAIASVTSERLEIRKPR